MPNAEGRESSARGKGPGRLSSQGFFGFENLEVYQLSKAMAKNLKPVIAQLPKEQQFALSGQLYRAGTSVGLNIAEGKGRGSDKDFVRYLYQARGSLLEVVAALDLCEAFDYLDRTQTQAVFDEAFVLNAKLTALIKALSSGPRP